VKLEEIQLKHHSELKAKANVTGTGIGYRYRNGKLTEEVCLLVFVDKKVSIGTLSAKDVIPTEIEGVKTDVQVRIAEAMQDRKSRMRPAPGGCSIGNIAVTAGTLGAVLYRGEDKVALSNNHVLACVDVGNLGDVIVQPGIYDGAKPDTDRLGVLYDFVPVAECDSAYVDCAICKPDNPDDVTSEILEVGEIAGIAEAQLGMSIQKSGRTTGLTKGVITVVNAIVDVGYGDARVIKLIGQLIADNIEGQSKVIAGGDSGSALLDMDKNLIGLCFAGSSDGAFLVANPIQPVLAQLSLTLEKSAPLPPPTPPLAPYEPPKADFTATPLEGVAPLTVEFRDCSTAPRGIRHYWWYFYNKLPDWVKEKDYTVTYELPGSYNVLHEVDDWRGNKSQKYGIITVLEKPKPKPKGCLLAPAKFSWSIAKLLTRRR
jgi:PKD repeat protein